jgi:Ca-activated chloride channel family protein
MLTVNMRHKNPGATIAKKFQLRLARSEPSTKTSNDFTFASSVLAYGMLLRKSEHSGDLTWEWVTKTAESHGGDDKTALRSGFIQLAKAASQL